MDNRDGSNNKKSNQNRRDGFGKKPYGKQFAPSKRNDFGEKPEKSGEDVSDSEEKALVYGRNPVLELLRSSRKPEKLFVSSGEREGSITLIVATAIEMGIPVINADKRKLDTLSEGGNHQGVVALSSFKDYCTVDDILNIAAEKGEPPFIVIADNIEDPRNLGALIRCIDIAGAHGLIIPKRHGSGMTATVSRSSAGALEYVPVAKVTNIAATIDDLKKKGIFVYGAEAGGQELKKTDLCGAAAFVFGSEGNGISRLVLDKCDFKVSVGMFGKINSLNVSCAAAVVLCEAAYQRNLKKG